MAEQIILNPPIIDNTISAFEIPKSEAELFSKGLEVIFYQYEDGALDPKYHDKYILVSVDAGGESVLKNKVMIFPFEKTRPTLSKRNNSGKITQKYKITILSNDLRDGYFTINSPMTVRLIFLKNNDNEVESMIKQNDENANWATWLDNVDNSTRHSNWSNGVLKYALAPITTEVYAGVTDSEILTVTPKPDSGKLLSEGTNNTFKLSYINDSYRIKVYCDYGQWVGNSEGTFTTIDEDIADNDTLLWYQAQLISIKNAFTHEVLEDSGQQFINRFWDESRRAFYYTFKHNFANDLLEDMHLQLVVLFATAKGYLFTKTYEIYYTADENISFESEKITPDPNLKLSNLKLAPYAPHGSIKVSVDLTNNDLVARYYAGTFTYYRAVVKNNLNATTLNWEMVHKKNEEFELDGNSSKTFTFEDITAEGGQIYKYKITFSYQSFDSEIFATTTDSNTKPELESSNTTLLVYEDIFLATKNAVLKIKYNPDITNFKRNVADVISPTLGGAYPFMRRNGQQIYRTFNIGGLLSYNSELFDGDESYDYPLFENNLSRYEEDSKGRSKKLYLPTEFEDSLFLKANSDTLKEFLIYKDPSLNLDQDAKRIIYEKLYRDKVMDFLYDDHIILFKSMTEGNIFVRLSNVSFTPNKQLGRSIWSFTAQATEVEAPTAENYLKHFGDNELPTEYVLSRMFSPLGNISKTADGSYNIQPWNSIENAISATGDLYISYGALVNTIEKTAIIETQSVTEKSTSLWGEEGVSWLNEYTSDPNSSASIVETVEETELKIFEDEISFKQGG